MFFAGRNDPAKRRQPVRAATQGGVAEAFREYTLTLVRTRPSNVATRQPCPVPVQRTTRFTPQPDRLILQSQSLSRSYGSALPTSLTYIILTTRGCSPWRPAADMGTAQQENHTTALGFSRADNSTLDSARAAELYGNNIPISRQTVFRESKPYKEKTTLPRAIADVSEFVCVTALVPEGTISLSEFGNINPIPFRIIFTVSLTFSGGCL